MTTEHYFLVEWPSGHSDPAKLKETAKEVRKLSPEELKGRQIELQVRFIVLWCKIWEEKSHLNYLIDIRNNYFFPN